jgi:hypothetical protein
VPGRREPAHVGPGLGHDDLCRGRRDPRDGGEQGDLGLKRDEALADLGAERGDGAIQEVEVVDHLAAENGVVSPEVALERLLEPVGLVAHLPLGHVG